MHILIKIILVLLVPICLAVIFLLYSPTPEVPVIQPGWYGLGERPEVEQEEDRSIGEIVVKIREEALVDLRRRVDSARFGIDLEEGTFEYGTQTAFMKHVRLHWLNKYDWRTHEKTLNTYKHFKTTIDGIQVHFTRALPENTDAKRVLLLLHGWPSSILEFYKMIPYLTHPQDHGGSEEDAFEVICPSIPGFGFSEAPHHPGFHTVAAARIFRELMDRLGHDRYYIRATDIAASIATHVAQLYPDNVLGLHLSGSLPQLPTGSSILHQVAVEWLPSLFLDPADRRRYKSFGEQLEDIFVEYAYALSLASKPDTPGISLNDSPIGLAAYVIEKFSTWSNPENRQLADGGLSDDLLDDLLTNVHIYWFTGSITSSSRLYKETLKELCGLVGDVERLPVNVPTGFASFANELFKPIRTFLSAKYSNIIHFSDLPTGGTFAALEIPDTLAEDIVAFVNNVEDLH